MKEAEDGLNALAEDTGGKAFFNTDDLQGAAARALDENRFYYALAYYPSDKEDKSFRRITVRVKGHPELRVRTQRGYKPVIESKDADAARTPQEKLSQALMSPLPPTDIGVSASAGFYASETDKSQVSYEAHINGQNLDYKESNGHFHFEFEIVTAVYALSGKRVDAYAETVSSNLPPQRLEIVKRNGVKYAKRIALAPGLYQFRVGVRDLTTNRLGASTAWVEVPDLSKRKLTLSDIFLSRDLNVDPVKRKDEKQSESAHTRTAQGIMAFGRGQFLIYRFMIYNAPASEQSESSLAMQLTISRGEDRIYQGPWQDIVPLLVKKDNIGLDVGGQFKLSLPPGIYDLTIAVKGSKSMRIVSKTVAFVVEPSESN